MLKSVLLAFFVICLQGCSFRQGNEAILQESSNRRPVKLGPAYQYIGKDESNFYIARRKPTLSVGPKYTYYYFPIERYLEKYISLASKKENHHLVKKIQSGSTAKKMQLKNQFLKHKREQKQKAQSALEAYKASLNQSAF